jgi:hypothetical protein
LTFSKVGALEDYGWAKEDADAPEAIEKPAILWHAARCTGVEDFVAAAEDFAATEGVGAALEEVAWGICPKGFAVEELGYEGIELEDFFNAGFFCIAFLGAALPAEASAAAA